MIARLHPDDITAIINGVLAGLNAPVICPEPKIGSPEFRRQQALKELDEKLKRRGRK